MTRSNVTPFNRGRSPPQFLAEAAHGSLKPPPTRRLRRAYLHLSYSMTISRLLDTNSHKPSSYPRLAIRLRGRQFVDPLQAAAATWDVFRRHPSQPEERRRHLADRH